jgi:hypothetical protein
VVAVEFPAFAKAPAGRPASDDDGRPARHSAGRWQVQGDRSAAPGIRAVAVMRKQAELVPQILAQHAQGKEWTVSMEQEYYVNNSGFLISRGDAERRERVGRNDVHVLRQCPLPLRLQRQGAPAAHHSSTPRTPLALHGRDRPAAPRDPLNAQPSLSGLVRWYGQTQR